MRRVLLGAARAAGATCGAAPPLSAGLRAPAPVAAAALRQQARFAGEPPAPSSSDGDAAPPKTDSEELSSNDFYVGGGSNVNKLAGACCYAIREYKTAGMRAIGPRAVNQAAKASAVARNFLEREGKGLLCRVENARVVSYERGTQLMPKLGAHILVYENDELIEVQEREDERILTVASRTLPRNLAAAIKHNIGSGRNITIRGVGPEAIENCILGIGFARNYCKQDEECDFDIGYVAEFSSLGDSLTGLSFMLIKLPAVPKDDI